LYISEEDFRKEISNVRLRLLSLEKDIGMIQKLEKSLAYHELVLSKKAADIKEMQQRLQNLPDHKDLEPIKTDLKKIEEHDSAINENTKFIRELMKEFEQTKDAHYTLHDQHQEALEEHKENSEKVFTKVSVALQDHKEEREKLESEMAAKIEHLERELADKISQIEYQNKLIMKYVKKIDEKMFSN
jgi:hypothetical protein